MDKCMICEVNNEIRIGLGLPPNPENPYCEHSKERLTPGFEVVVEGDYASFDRVYVFERQWEHRPGDMSIAFGFDSEDEAAEWINKYCRHGYVEKGAPDGNGYQRISCPFPEEKLR